MKKVIKHLISQHNEWTTKNAAEFSLANKISKQSSFYTKLQHLSTNRNKNKKKKKTTSNKKQ